MLTKKSPKKPQNFNCDNCDFSCSKQKDWNRHISTLKHQKIDQCLPKDPLQKPTKKYICECGKEYSYKQSIYVHRQKCPIINETKNDIAEKHILIAENERKNDIIIKLLNQNNELQQQVINLCKTNNSTTNNFINNNVNSNNKTFNLQLFLNETCKDAMNIMDFVDSLNLQLTDLENIGKLGFVEGLSNIIVRNLKELDITRRPLHCSDSKREVLYIKDENKWEKENEENKKLKKAIKYIAHKNCKLIPEWKEQNPDCIYSNSKKSDQYNKIVIESMGQNIDSEMSENKIIKKIVKEVIIEKNI
jgi:hypothetical protein